jgi:hypothetical protein
MINHLADPGKDLFAMAGSAADRQTRAGEAAAKGRTDGFKSG